MTAHPLDAAALFARKLYYTFNAAHVPLPHSYPFYAHDERTALRFYGVGPWLVIPLGLVGLIAAAPPARRREYVIWASFVPAYASAVALFFVAERYRLPLLLPLCAASGAAIDAAARALEARRWTGLVAGAGAVAVLAIASNWRLGLDDGRWLEGLRTAQQLAILQRYEEAYRWAARLDASGAPQPGAGRYGLAAQFLILGQPERALPLLQAAHRLDPSNARMDYALGQALLGTGRADDAVVHLRQGFDAGIELPKGGIDLALALQSTGDLGGAAAIIGRINPSPADDVEAWLGAGRLAAEVRAPQIAERFFRRAVQLRPAQASARQHLGLNLLVLERFAEAAGELREASRLDPRDADSLSHLAYCELKLGRAADARSHAIAALAINPDDQLAGGIIRAGGS
jgi:tetratricopeptide (TPR) repeat protein